MKKFNVYSKTYTSTTLDRAETLIVDNVHYHLAKNKKKMIKVSRKQSNSQLNSIEKSPIIAKHRICKETNYQSFISKNFKRLNGSKLAFKNRNRFKFNKVTKFNSFRSTASSNLYKKTYNVPNRTRMINSLKIQQNRQTKIVHQLRMKAVKSSINCLIRNRLQKNKNSHLKLSTDNTIYCMFFCRFGKCAKIDTCKYKHDQDKVAVCKNFLKGKCEVNGCLLSHKIDPKKMPVCQYFLKGICNIDNCPYRHVNVNVNAEICKDFVKGFCGKGDQCKLLHQYIKQCKKCKSNQCNCKKELNDKELNKNKLVRQEVNQKEDKIIELIESDVKSDDELNSNMDISDADDNLVNKNELCLDFIPLVKDLKEENVDINQEQITAGRTSRTDLTPTDYQTNSNYDYESDDSWFEDEEQTMNSFNIQYIPKFLLN